MGTWPGADPEHGRETEKVPSGQRLLESGHRWHRHGLASSGSSPQRAAPNAGSLLDPQPGPPSPWGVGTSAGRTPTPPADPLTGSRAWALGAPQWSPQRTQAASGASSQALGNSGGGQGAVGRATDTGLHSPPALWPQLPTGHKRAAAHPSSPGLVWKPASWGPSRSPHQRTHLGPRLPTHQPAPQFPDTSMWGRGNGLSPQPPAHTTPWEPAQSWDPELKAPKMPPC